MNYEGYYREKRGGCYFHPKEEVIGVCALCLKERLLILAAKQGAKPKPSKYNYPKFRTRSSYNNYASNNNNNNKNNNNLHKTKSYVTFPKIFALGSLFIPSDNCKSDDVFLDAADYPDDITSTSLEDESFISIKFGDNGVASWDKGNSNKVSKVSLQNCSMSWGGQTSVKDKKGINNSNNNTNKRVVEQTNHRSTSLRWQNRIGQLLQVIKWKKSNRSSTNARGGENGKVEGVKMVRNNKSWIKTLRIKAKE